MKSRVRWWTNSIIREFRDSERLYGLRQRKAKPDGVRLLGRALLKKSEKGRTYLFRFMFNDKLGVHFAVKVAHPPALRGFGYEKIKTKCWNDRPTY